MCRCARLVASFLPTHSLRATFRFLAFCIAAPSTHHNPHNPNKVTHLRPVSRSTALAFTRAPLRSGSAARRVCRRHQRRRKRDATPAGVCIPLPLNDPPDLLPSDARPFASLCVVACLCGWGFTVSHITLIRGLVFSCLSLMSSRSRWVRPSPRRVALSCVCLYVMSSLVCVVCDALCRCCDPRIPRVWADTI